MSENWTHIATGHCMTLLAIWVWVCVFWRANAATESVGLRQSVTIAVDEVG